MTVWEKFKNLFKEKCIMCGKPGNGLLCQPCKDDLWEKATAEVAEERAEAARKAKERAAQAELKAETRRRYFIDIVKEAVKELEKEKQSNTGMTLE